MVQNYCFFANYTSTKFYTCFDVCKVVILSKKTLNITQL